MARGDEDRLRELLRGIKDGLRDEVLTMSEVASCFDEKTTKAIEAVVEKANEKRRKLPADKRYPWRTQTPDDVVQAQIKAGLRDASAKPQKLKVRTFPAEIGGTNGSR